MTLKETKHPTELFKATNPLQPTVIKKRTSAANSFDPTTPDRAETQNTTSTQMPQKHRLQIPLRLPRCG